MTVVLILAMEEKDLKIDFFSDSYIHFYENILF